MYSEPSAVSQKLAGVGLSKMCKIFIIGGRMDQTQPLIGPVSSVVYVYKKKSNLPNHPCLPVFGKLGKNFGFGKN
jgi:hypothetical protein